MVEFTYHGQEIAYTVPALAGQEPKYVVAVTWIREGAYFVEVRYNAHVGRGHRYYEKSFSDESLARADARRCIEICK